MVWLQWKELQQAQTMSHTTGRTTFALVKHNLRKKNPDGAEPSRIQMHKVTHTRKDDKIVDEASREIILTIEDIAEADPYLGNLFGRYLHGFCPPLISSDDDAKYDLGIE
ncbi:uncharacterized protein LOC122065192 isoform X2 [Macadamia integrifolia]|uniref:uncharacterized protein LOC122065192 isoform X2 n=1 Tax=Macadamia integrifolia TaxID=60698 RepID=UPI001C4EB0CA|nr:uncharacterized protein LOC122065192 isoform X2 [Macadamia integrifolia]